jgi:hypothetical protein
MASVDAVLRREECVGAEECRQDTEGHGGKRAKFTRNSIIIFLTLLYDESPPATA